MSAPRPPRIAVRSPASRHGTLSRFRALAEAVRRHERIASGGAVSKRPSDHALYRRLSELEGSLPFDAVDRNGNAPLRSPLRGH